MSDDALAALVAEQISYDRARAVQYDHTAPVDADSRAQLDAALTAFAPGGRVLERTCGTGQWTVDLAHHADRLTAVDASVEMTALTGSLLGVATAAHPTAGASPVVGLRPPGNAHDVTASGMTGCGHS